MCIYVYVQRTIFSSHMHSFKSIIFYLHSRPYYQKPCIHLKEPVNNGLPCSWKCQQWYWKSTAVLKKEKKVEASLGWFQKVKSSLLVVSSTNTSQECFKKGNLPQGYFQKWNSFQDTFKMEKPPKSRAKFQEGARFRPDIHDLTAPNDTSIGQSYARSRNTAHSNSFTSLRLGLRYCVRLYWKGYWKLYSVKCIHTIFCKIIARRLWWRSSNCI